MYIGGKKDADKPEYIRKSMCEISEVELCKAFGTDTIQTTIGELNLLDIEKGKERERGSKRQLEQSHTR